ncbi:hypothetical protein J5N97_023297 [Dioscorea zingiberensis]|uniref:CCT domain-containing protein n=1 Tax=Dioscorea zingiberensis TaxID=325984 RepID=A0A9D5CDT9_9LILI|nr:hypothetical protein J5N97_023297 [Dioscorea zingiberensis]
MYYEQDNITELFAEVFRGSDNLISGDGGGGALNLTGHSDELFSPLLYSTTLDTRSSPSSISSPPLSTLSFIDDPPIMLPENIIGGYSLPAMPVSYAGLDAGRTSSSFLEPEISSYFPGIITDMQFPGDTPAIYNYQTTTSMGGGAFQPSYNSGDMQVIMENKCNTHAPLPILEESNLRIGRLSLQERKEKIHRYLKKRNERNFSKKIKYACRKTLADSRPRVRGRFAKNDDLGETMRSSSIRHDDEESPEKKEVEILLKSLKKREARKKWPLGLIILFREGLELILGMELWR